MTAQCYSSSTKAKEVDSEAETRLSLPKILSDKELSAAPSGAAALRDEILSANQNIDPEKLGRLVAVTKELAKNNFNPEGELGSKLVAALYTVMTEHIDSAESFRGFVEAIKEMELRAGRFSDFRWERIKERQAADQLDSDSYLAIAEEVVFTLAAYVKKLGRNIENLDGDPLAKDRLRAMADDARDFKQLLFEPYISQLGGQVPCPDIRDAFRKFDKELVAAFRQA